ncbi:NUDIX hydrolase [Nocardiopsis ansamitocini]|uniref:NTP pyrophosphohydrolase n=1 Tax=Nocardiopsis ansamitocini TaxID=1670832 RepID=A0A9W6P911_9ACTN|nr:NUDIX hydrolase [Nocardiopsis ansamitocini]GLU49825.1 NTP pyrophosphohydrolase [Nocardiopsis ansamitocini]
MLKGDGDGWVVLADGSRRWGRYGAAGLLLHAVGTTDPGHVLMQYRSGWTHQGNTWGLPGGARNSGETSITAALREFGEEVAGDLGPVDLEGVHRQDLGVWVFDTVLASTRERRPFFPGNHESTIMRWVPVAEVADLPLLPALGVTWPDLYHALSQPFVLVVDATNASPPRDAIGTLHDEVAELVRVGVPDDVLPPDLGLAPLHRRFPTALFVVDASAPALEPAPGTQVVRTAGPAGTTVLEVARSHADAACTVVVTDDSALRLHCVAAGTHPVPLSWLHRASRSDGGR